MTEHNSGPAADVEQLLGDVGTTVLPDAAFRQSLAEALTQQLAVRRGEGPLPAGWALCPFDRFCIAEQPLPRLLRKHCPCSHAHALLQPFAGGDGAVHVRPCPARALRTARPA